MAYDPPIHLFQAKWSEMREDAVDKAVLEEIHKLGVLVDRGELVKALEHDRDQYQKGYADGRADAAKWISVEERLPEDRVLAINDRGVMAIGWIGQRRLGGVMVYVCDEWDSSIIIIHVTHWMPLPEPPEGDEDATD